MARVVAQQAAFARQKVNVVTISFADRPQWATAWLEETHSPFPLLIDSQRVSYRAYGLQRSFWRSWGANNLLYYNRALRQGERLYGRRGDSLQLGGDFFISPEGKVCWAKPSRDPTDRPSIESLLSRVGNC